ncbi:efflux RND transporter periplasmic adaptor subunit [Roseicyclus persicicus]|uniref:HlyD family efflux transporter periplasmic adaptor subunit n=1 Tax=Roseicyclus persicicus TaxID=2650661 RepID=A0A7X6GYP7_9RHOB|nr:HlyD family efflux transporter periplasmic adaptor subunit [Roseibacterium persicicum]NKX44844.1 HlyD family efflux transporter periplasmic adaptor subunit [Roseibacterium persicicum]
MVWTTRTIALSLAGAALIGGLAWVAFREDPVPVDLIEVTAGPMQVTIDADARTRIREVYEVAAPIAGTALRAPVVVGDPVAAGVTVVARVEPASPALLDARSRAQAEAAVAEAQAALEVARADLTRAEEERAFAAMQFDRTQALVQRGVSSVTQLETVTQQLAVADAAVAAARSRIAMSTGTLDRAQAALMGPEGGAAPAACCVDLTAPADGVVLSIATISEHPVQAGAPLVTVGDPGDLEIVADLLSSDAVRIGPGTRAIVERWGGPGALEAVLRRVEPAAETRVSALGIEEQRVDVIFDLVTPPEARAGLGHGFSVFLRVVEWETDSAVQVPLGAVFRRGDGWAVFVVADGLAEERAVTLGRRGARTAEVLAGLTPGERIVTHPSDAVADGVAVVDRRAM